MEETCYVEIVFDGRLVGIGERARLACWFRRLAETVFEHALVICRRALVLETLGGKVRAGESPPPARESRALRRALDASAWSFVRVHSGMRFAFASARCNTIA